MNNISVTQFKEMDNNGKIDTFELNDVKYSYLSYLPIKEKIQIINSIVMTAFYDLNNQYTGLNSFRLEISKVVLIATTYLQNVNFPKKNGEIDYVKTYDILTSSGIYAHLANALNSIGEFNNFNTLLNNRIADFIEIHKSDATDSVAELVDLIRTKEAIELESIKIQGRLTEEMVNNMPKDPEKAQQWVDDMTKQLKSLTNLENFDLIQNVSDKSDLKNIR